MNAGLHRFTVANLTTMEGREGTPGAFGGWALVVIYAEDDTLGKPRNISIYNGFVSIDTHNDPITISGFKLPSSNDISSQLSVFSGEGEYLYGKNPSNNRVDWMKISDNYSTGYEYMPGKSAGTQLGNRDNMFDAKLDNILRDHIDGEYNDQSQNNNGVDVDTYDVSDLMSTYRTSNPNINTVYIKMYSDQDYITSSMMAFSAELYVPKLCYDYTLDIGGFVIPSNDNRIQTGFGSFGVPLTNTVYIRSLEGDLDLQDVNVSYNIQNTNQLQYTYNHCSTEISENSIYTYQDACPYTVHQNPSGFTMYIGTGKTPTSGGTIGALEERYIKFDSNFMTSSVDTNFDFSIDYTVNYGSGAVALHKDFNASDLCPASGGGFQPTFGIFNVIDGNAPTYNQYNLFTQVAGRPFTLQIYGHDKTDPVQPVASDLNVTVEVELIRADDFAREADVACNNERSIIPGTTSKFVYINNAKNAFVTYDANDTDFAYRSVAARVWYLTHTDGSLVLDHNCTSYNPVGCTILYARDFASAHECDAECLSAGSGCYACLRAYHGDKSCSRDNFAIRPEAFVTQLIDSNQNANIDGPSNLVTYSRSGAANSGNVVAGYDYRFDVNATNHVNDRPTDQYRAAFVPAATGLRAQMEWEGPTGGACNDPDDKNITFEIFDGSTVNYNTRLSYVDKVDQIGEYRFIIYDSSWTAADWDDSLMAHHFGTYSAHFLSGDDCVPNSATVLSNVTPTSANNKNGCDISSVHTNPDTGASYTYLDMHFYPYKFDVSGLTADIRPSHTPPAGPEDFIYMNTPGADDLNMSYNIHGTYKAVGYTGNEVENFVANCYAEDTHMNLIRSSSDPSAMLSYDLSDFNTSHPEIIIRPHEQDEFTSEPLNITQGAQYYSQDMKGAISMDLGYNYERMVNVAVNPRRVVFRDFNITFASNPDISVDLINDHKVYGNLELDDNVTFLYGRVHAPRYRVECNSTVACSTTTSPNRPLVLYNEFYYDQTASIDANDTLTAFSSETNRSVDSVNWYKNYMHAQSDGNVSSVVQYYGNNVYNSSPISVTAPTTIANGISTVDANYTGLDSYPYKATMGIRASEWQIYNRFDAAADHNTFELEFNAARIGDDANLSSDINITSPNTSRRIRW